MLPYLNYSVSCITLTLFSIPFPSSSFPITLTCCAGRFYSTHYHQSTSQYSLFNFLFSYLIMSSPKSIKSNSSVSSIKSDISTLSDDSFRAGNKLTEALTALLDEQGIFTVRKQVSHDAKKLDPKKAPVKNVKFENGSGKINEDYYAYKAEVEKIKPLKDAYTASQKAAKNASTAAPHEKCIKDAEAWKKQAVK